MLKVWQIIKREYITRVRKRAFIIMSIIGPLLFAILLIAPHQLAKYDDKGQKKFAIIELDEYSQPVTEENLLFGEVIPQKENIEFEYLSNIDTSTIKHMVMYADYDGVLTINHNLINSQNNELVLYAKKQPSITLEGHIKQSLEHFLFEQKLQNLNLSADEINSYKTTLRLNTQKLEKSGFEEQDSVDVKRGIGYAAGFMIYFFIFFFGAQVMRGVIEEKTSRVIEVIITSVRPFQLMMGKIVGIALVGLTQFLAWVLLTMGIYQFATTNYLEPNQNTQVALNSSEEIIDQPSSPVMNSGNSSGIINDLNSLGIPFYFYLIGSFLFYFIFGYLLYASLFAAIGSAVDSETDTQQFMLPVTIPLIISVIVMVNAITNPDSHLVFWFSLIPFTSPVVMMARIPFSPPASDLILSMTLLVGTFLAMTWLAGKIYRTGILMYGKKVSYKELLKWIRYRD